MTDEEYARWPKCAVPACQNKSCLSLASRYCWPHTPGSAADARENLRDTEPPTPITHKAVAEIGRSHHAG